jgi:serine/threonine protein kinase
MGMSPDRWKVISPSEFPWEQEAFDFLRTRLPDLDPYAAWQNFSFLGENGSIYEIDALVLTPLGLFLVEVKSSPGVLSGDSGNWTWKHDGRLRTVDNPVFLADRKAKLLAGVLRRQRAFKELRCPFIEPLVFCSAPDLQLQLPENARTRVCLRDRDADGNREPRDGIVAALKFGRIPGIEGSRSPRIDRPVMVALSRAIEQAGIRQSERHRVISDYRLRALLMEGPGWQDWEGQHVSVPDNRRRVRRYTIASAATAEQRETLKRAARREFQVLEGLAHPGILSVRGFTENEFGPAVLFEHHDKAVRLDQYLATSGSGLGFDARLSLVRQLAEALQYAHRRLVYHRALSPKSVLISGSDDEPRARIFNWQTSERQLSSSVTNTPGGRAVTATVHVDQLVEDEASLYLAPEGLLERQTSGEQLDVFSLGAVAYFILTGRRPAASFAELQQRLRESRGLQLSEVLDSARSGRPSEASEPQDDLAGVLPRCQSLHELVQLATHPELANRIGTIAEFLELLTLVEDELTTPATAEEPVHPHAAKPGDHVAADLLVKGRLGTGSTSIVLLVEHEGHERVLKVALSTDQNERLRQEAAILGKLRHQHIVAVHSTYDLDGLVGILMDRAGKTTLARRLKDDGRLHPDLLQRFGDDLLQTLDWLEHQGIPHRDIKPDNIGVSELGRGSQLHLVLFDFSLSKTPLDNIRAGTTRYLDPFLPLRKPPRWDTAAERWAAAVTLLEMATGPTAGEPLRWGDGQTAPHMLDDEVTLDGDRFDPELREGLLAFFTQALRRDPQQRFHNCRDMLDAWRGVFTQATPKVAEDDLDRDRLLQQLQDARLDTPVAGLGLSGRAVSALDRLNVRTVHDLLRQPPRRVWRMRGVGNRTRRQLGSVLRVLHDRFPDVEPDTDTATTTHGGEETTHQVVWSVDRLVDTLLGKADQRSAQEATALRQLLNLDRRDTPALGHWETQTDVANALKLPKPRLHQWVVAARKRWQKNASLTAVRDELVKLLGGQGGVMTAAELATAVLATRGSHQSDDDARHRLATAVVRAAFEVETSLAQPALAVRRRGRVAILSVIPEAAEPTALCDYAVRLGDAADKLAADDEQTLPTPQRVLETLRRIGQPPSTAYLSDIRLVTLAAAASQKAAVSSLLEIYPRGMPARRALKLSLGGLGGMKRVSVEQLRERVTGRYPAAEPPPGRPELDVLLRELEWTYSWNPLEEAYLSRLVPHGSSTSEPTSLPRLVTTPGPVRLTPAAAEAVELDEHLQRSLKQGAFLTLLVPHPQALRAVEELQRRYALDLLDLDELFIAELQTQAQARRVQWDKVLEADAAGPESPHWGRLTQLAAATLEALEPRLLSRDRPLLLIYPGLVARYEQLGFLDRLRDGCGRPGSTPGLWLLVCTRGRQSTLPTIDNHPVPVLGRSQWAWVPEAWLSNVHRGSPIADSLLSAPRTDP